MNYINPAIEDMIAHKKLSDNKIESLIFLKKYADRVSTGNYLPDNEVEKIEKKFGVKPDVISWGDYFQTQVAGEHWDKSDEDFQNVIETIHYDLIASVMIFNNKSAEFLHDVDLRFNEINESDPEKLSPEDQEMYHLKILKDYYQQMDLDIKLYSDQDFNFFKQYSESEVS